MERNVRRRIRLVCPGCDDMFHSQHSFNLHLLSSEFCYFVDQCGVNTNQPSSNQQFPTSGNGINDSSKFQTKGPVPYEFVSDHYRVSLDDYIPSEIHFQPINEIDSLPEPPNLLDPDILLKRAKTSNLLPMKQDHASTLYTNSW